MKEKVNIKARIKRHSRILKEGIINNTSIQKKGNNGYNIVLFLVLVLMPIYPSLASFVHGSSSLEFYRGDIDESSILGSYFGESDGAQRGSSGENDSFLSVKTILDDTRDLSGTNEIINYEVEPGDNFSSIAYKFKVSTRSIYDSNDFSKYQIIHPGDVIKIPPISGLIYKVSKGDTVSSIAKKYDIEEDKILEQNLLGSASDLKFDEVIVIPGAVKIKPIIKKAPARALNLAKNLSGSSSGGYSFAKKGKSEYVNVTGQYKLVYRKPQHTFYWGNCTWYVGQYKNVNWGGNAKDWLRNAKAKGHSTGSNATIGSIVVLHGRGYNPRYGHVGIVMDIKGSDLIISDMNYRRLGEVTYRKISANDRAITGYIYVD